MLEGRTLWELIERRAAATPDARMAVDESGREMTFGEYKTRAERAAAALAELGIGPGDVVTWQLPTWLESMVLVAAISRLGATQNPILHIFREREVGFCVQESGAKLIVTPSTFANFDFEAMAREIADDLDGVEVLVCDRALPEADPSSLPAPPTDGNEVRWLFYTSGTTADPKGARHTDLTINAEASGMVQRLEVTDTDRNALAFPFPHIGGIAWLYSSLMTGCQNILFEAFVPDQVVKVLGEHDVTLAGSGTVFHQTYLAAQRQSDTPIFPHVRAFPGGGAPKPAALHYEMREAFPGSVGIVSGYGLTEAPILTMASIHDTDDDLANTEGFAMPGVELALVTQDGKVAGVGEEGEVRAKGPQVMKGYVNGTLDAEAFDDEGYFRTGDLGRLNERGMLTITGRIKDIIIRKGENVSAKEVEDHLYRHPKVADVAVIGLPDERSGERVCAVVAIADGQETLVMAEMVEFLKGEGLMIQKVPEQLEIVEVIPRNPAGKVLKNDLRDRYTD
jgi:cyclohexanecarboxylate-CoA ligase